jgi:cytochrome P450
VKGISDKDQISSSLKDFLPRFLCYTLFDVPVDLIPLDDIVTAHTSTAFLLFHAKLPCCIYRKLKPKIIRSARERVTDVLLEHSRVLKDVPDGPDGLTRNDLVGMLHMVFGIAAFGGTSALAISCLTQMPEGYADEVMHDEDNAKLRNAVLECSRLDAPVPSAHCIVDDDEGFTTQIGGKAIKFPNSTVLCTGIILANIDEKRYPNPFVFDPENRDFSNLTTFNSVGDSTNPSAPRICPGREVALSAVMLMMKAKSEAESAQYFAVAD